MVFSFTPSGTSKPEDEKKGETTSETGGGGASLFGAKAADGNAFKPSKPSTLGLFSPTVAAAETPAPGAPEEKKESKDDGGGAAAAAGASSLFGGGGASATRAPASAAVGLSASASSVGGTSATTVKYARFDRTWRALWTSLESPGTTSILGAEKLAVVLERNREPLGKLLDFFKPRSSASKAALEKDSVEWEGRKLPVDTRQRDFLLRLAAELQLDELQCFRILRTFLRSEWHASDHFEYTDERLEEVIFHYYDERASLLQVMCALVRVAEDEDHFYHAQAVDVVKHFLQAGVADRALAQYEAAVQRAVPTHLSQARAVAWTTQCIREQALYLELLFLIYYTRVTCPPKTVVALAQTMGRLEMGTKQPNVLLLEPAGRRYLHRCSYLVVAILLEVMQLETLLVADDESAAEMDTVRANKDLLANDAAAMAALDQVLSEWGTSNVRPHGPVLLAWAAYHGRAAQLKLVDGDGGEAFRVYGPRALQLQCFAFLGDMFAESDSHSGFCEEPIVAGLKSIVKGLMGILTAAFDVAELPQFLDVTRVLAVAVDGQPAIAKQFWTDDQTARAVLDIARQRFPAQFPPLTHLLTSLAADAECAHTVFQYFAALPTYTCVAGVAGHEYALQALQIDRATGTSLAADARAMDDSDEDKAYDEILAACVTKQLVLLSSRYCGPIFLQPGTMGRVVSTASGSEPASLDDVGIEHVVEWHVPVSGWVLFMAIVEEFVARVEFLATNDQIDQIDDDGANTVTIMLELVAKMLKQDCELGLALHVHLAQVAGVQHGGNLLQQAHPLIEPLTAILSRLSLSPRPPLRLLAACGLCLHRLAPSSPANLLSVWTLLGQVESFRQADSRRRLDFAMLGVLERALRAEKSIGVYHLSRSVVHMVATLTETTLHLTRLPTVAGRTLPDAEWQRLAGGTFPPFLADYADFLLNRIFVPHSTWRYSNRIDRWSLARQVLSVTLTLMDAAQLQSDEPVVASFFVYRQLLLNPSLIGALLALLAPGPSLLEGVLLNPTSVKEGDFVGETLALCLSIVTRALRRLLRDSAAASGRSKEDRLQLVNCPLAVALLSSDRSSVTRALVRFAQYPHDAKLQLLAIEALTMVSQLAQMQQELAASPAALYAIGGVLASEMGHLRDFFVDRMLDAMPSNAPLRIAILRFIATTLLAFEQRTVSNYLLQLFDDSPPGGKSGKRSDGDAADGGGKCQGILLGVVKLACNMELVGKRHPLLGEAVLELLLALWQVSPNQRRLVTSWKDSAGKPFWDLVTAPLFADDAADGSAVRTAHQTFVRAFILRLVGLEMHYGGSDEFRILCKRTLDKVLAEPFLRASAAQCSYDREVVERVHDIARFRVERGFTEAQYGPGGEFDLDLMENVLPQTMDTSRLQTTLAAARAVGDMSAHVSSEAALRQSWRMLVDLALLPSPTTSGIVSSTTFVAGAVTVLSALLRDGWVVHSHAAVAVQLDLGAVLTRAVRYVMDREAAGIDDAVVLNLCAVVRGIQSSDRAAAMELLAPLREDVLTALVLLAGRKSPSASVVSALCDMLGVCLVSHELTFEKNSKVIHLIVLLLSRIVGKNRKDTFAALLGSSTMQAIVTVFGEAVCVRYHGRAGDVALASAVIQVLLDVFLSAVAEGPAAASLVSFGLMEIVNDEALSAAGPHAYAPSAVYDAGSGTVDANQPLWERVVALVAALVRRLGHGEKMLARALEFASIHHVRISAPLGFTFHLPPPPDHFRMSLAFVREAQTSVYFISRLAAHRHAWQSRLGGRAVELQAAILSLAQHLMLLVARVTHFVHHSRPISRDELQRSGAPSGQNGNSGGEPARPLSPTLTAVGSPGMARRNSSTPDGSHGSALKVERQPSIGSGDISQAARASEASRTHFSDQMALAVYRLLQTTLETLWTIAPPVFSESLQDVSSKAPLFLPTGKYSDAQAPSMGGLLACQAHCLRKLDMMDVLDKKKDGKGSSPALRRTLGRIIELCIAHAMAHIELFAGGRAETAAKVDQRVFRDEIVNEMDAFLVKLAKYLEKQTTAGDALSSDLPGFVETSHRRVKTRLQRR